MPRSEAAAPPDGALIASSTSGILPSELQAEPGGHPERLLVAHPFNPVYLLPLVELVGGAETADPRRIARAHGGSTRALGMHPLRRPQGDRGFRRRPPAGGRSGANALWLVKDGICHHGGDRRRHPLRLRPALWAQMGIFETYRVAGGEAGMRTLHRPVRALTLKWPWTRLTDVPDFNDELVDLIAEQSDAQSGHMSIREMERIRDDNLVAILHALKANGWGAGQLLSDYEKRLVDAATPAQEAADFSRPVKTLDRPVPADWTDYNGHMTEARYAQCFSDATDAFMVMIGCDADYIAAGGSYFTVENHVRFLDEVKVNEPVTATTQLIEGAGKKLHLFHELYHGDGRLLATGETLLIHVSLETRAASAPAPQILAKLAEIAALHAELPAPEGLGRAIGRKS